MTKPPKYEVFEGKLTTRCRMKWEGTLLSAPGMLTLFIFLLLPIVGLIVLAFMQRGAYGTINWTPSVDNLKRLIGFSSFGWAPDNAVIVARSLILATVTTLICLLIAFPMSFWIAAHKKSTRALLLALVMVPSCTNLVIRTYAWMLVLGAQMPPTWIARAIGLIGETDSLYPGQFAVYIGMVSSMLPFAVLPLYTSVERLDWNIVEATRDLYASPLRSFCHGVLSQMKSGIVASIILTLVPSLGMYVVSDLLGGSKYMLIGNLIQQQFGSASDWPFGAMLGVILILASVLSLAVFQKVGGGRNYV
ncbi:MAG: ABC transporter permease [Fibrobacteraceae bacterium]|nr:ABC transporter permease [Fibrobacteraceae bacterium]